MITVMDNQKPDDQDEKPPNLLQVVLSILASAIGIQTSANRKRDFSKGNPLVFIVGGLIFTTVFVLILIFTVNMVLSD